MKRTDNIARHAEVSEKAIEKYLSREVGKLGGLSLKYANANPTGYPDRLICLSGGRAAWAEIKSQGKKPTKIQLIRHEELKRLGFKVWVIDSRQKVKDLIKELQDEI